MSGGQGLRWVKVEVEMEETSGEDEVVVLLLAMGIFGMVWYCLDIHIEEMRRCHPMDFVTA